MKVFFRALLVAAGLALCPPALAQGLSLPPPAPANDENGVSLLYPDIVIQEPSISVGRPDSGGLSFQRKRNIRTMRPNAYPNYGAYPGPNWIASSYFGYVSGGYLGEGNSGAYSVVTSSQSKWFGGNGITFSPQIVDGSKLELVGGNYIFTASDGTRVTFATTLASGLGYLTYFSDGGVPFLAGPGTGYIAVEAVITQVEKPDGEVITWHYIATSNSFDPFGLGTGAPQIRLQSVTNNLGYQVHFKYKRNASTASTYAELADWYTFDKVTVLDNGIDACAPTALACDSTSLSWPILTYGNDSPTVETVVDRLGNTSRYTYGWSAFPPGSSCESKCRDLVAVRSPQASANDLELSQADTSSTVNGVRGGMLSLNSSKGSWTYTYSVTGSQGLTPNLTISGPNGFSRYLTGRDVEFGGGAGPAFINAIKTDLLNGRTTSYQYEEYTSAYRHIGTTRPDGDYSTFTYDARQNITQVRSVAKPGSGLADIYQYASYPELGAAVCVNAKTCNKPDWVTIASPASGTPSSLPKTSYTYDAAHGGLLTETKPAPGAGPYAAIAPQTRFTYAAIAPQTRYTYAAVGGVTRVATVKSCRTTASCAGTADETVVETTYNAKRVPSLVVTRAGNNATAFTATNTRVATTYSPQGDVESIDGPLSGTVDTIWNYYDTMRRLRVTVAPDPDAAGSLFYRVTRTTYDADGLPTMVEQGAVGTPSSCSAANSFCPSTMVVHARSTVAYDSFGRKVRQNAINVSTSAIEAVTQTSYDVAGRVACVATRMNPAVYGSLPDPTLIQPLTNPTGGACAQSATGAFGQDQITRTAYDANGDPTVIQTGYATTLVRNERQFTYLAPGQVATLKDAVNNLTTYEYDGFNRLKKLRYPAATAGANASSTTDYEEYGYDPSGNKTSERRRDGLMIASTYDTLNRLRTIDKPGAELDVTNSYDNFDNLITASQTGSSVTWGYDALGRVTSEAQGLGTVSYTYDTAGRRTRLTYPGASFYVNYQYFDDGRLKLVGLNGATTGANVQATYYDDQLGRRASMCRGTGTTSSCSSVARTVYSYDPISRLSSLTHDLITGTSANDVAWTLAYSPASQLVSRTSASTLYQWSHPSAFADTYAPANGLNQYTTVAGLSLAYDGRGNTTNDTTKTYTYDSSNMLTSSSNGAALTYDPTGRLLSIAQGGVTTKFLYDGTRLIAEYNGSNTLLRRYIHGDGVDDPIVWYDSTGTTNKRNLFKDERGSVIAADTGSAVTSLKYDEFGNVTVTGSAPPRFRYTGQTWLPEIGQYYYKARIYNPDLGRFMQTDPIGTKDQINLYAYVGNDPFNKTDPSGMCMIENTFCRRKERYQELSRDPVLKEITVFPAAAATTLDVLDTPRTITGYSKSTVSWLEKVSARLESENRGIFGDLKAGKTVEGITNATDGVDRGMVRFEQGLVQQELDSLKASNPALYSQVVGESNRVFRSFGFASGPITAASRALGHTPDFAQRADRERIGYETVRTEAAWSCAKDDACNAGSLVGN